MGYNSLGIKKLERKQRTNISCLINAWSSLDISDQKHKFKLNNSSINLNCFFSLSKGKAGGMITWDIGR